MPSTLRRGRQWASVLGSGVKEDRAKKKTQTKTNQPGQPLGPAQSHPAPLKEPVPEKRPHPPPPKLNRLRGPRQETRRIIWKETSGTASVGDGEMAAKIAPRSRPLFTSGCDGHGPFTRLHGKTLKLHFLKAQNLPRVRTGCQVRSTLAPERWFANVQPQNSFPTQPSFCSIPNLTLQ